MSQPAPGFLEQLLGVAQALSPFKARVSQKMNAKTMFKTKTKTSVWGPANPISTSDAGGRSVPFAQFVKDLLEFEVTGVASCRSCETAGDGRQGP